MMLLHGLYVICIPFFKQIKRAFPSIMSHLHFMGEL